MVLGSNPPREAMTSSFGGEPGHVEDAIYLADKVFLTLKGKHVLFKLQTVSDYP